MSEVKYVDLWTDFTKMLFGLFFCLVFFYPLEETILASGKSRSCYEINLIVKVFFLLLLKSLQTSFHLLNKPQWRL